MGTRYLPNNTIIMMVVIIIVPIIILIAIVIVTLITIEYESSDWKSLDNFLHQYFKPFDS